MSFRLHVASVSSWNLSTIGGSLQIEAGVPLLSAGSETGLAAGGGGMWLEVTSQKHQADVYRLFIAFASMSVGLGASLLGNVTVDISTQYNPASGTPIARVGPISPNDSGADGDPTGFLGGCFLLSGGVSVGNALSVSMLLMGPPVGWQEQIAAAAVPFARYKYLAGIGGHSFNTAFSADVGVQAGVVTQIINRSRGDRDVLRDGPSTLTYPLTS